MCIFNKDFIKIIIEKYFVKDNISNYVYYSDILYENLGLLLNEMIYIPEYHKYCYIFSENVKLIKFDELLEDYDILLEYQSIIMFVYEVLLKLQLLDYYNYIIDDSSLFNELIINNEFSFMTSLVNELNFNYEMNIISKQFKNI
jgi:hypothetical protein